jgi:hypothetical protein
MAYFRWLWPSKIVLSTVVYEYFVKRYLSDLKSV